MSVPLSIVLIVLIAVAALGIGLLLRRLLVQRLKDTILDNWLVQTIGVVVVIIPLFIAGIFAPAIYDSNLLGPTWDRIKGFLSSSLHIDIGFGFLGGFIETIIVIILGLGIARTLMRLAIRGLGESRVDINIRTFIGRILYIITVIVVLFWVLAIWNIAIGIPVAVLGTLTVAVTFSVQDILKDLVAGFYLLIERPFHIGDLITIGDPNHAAGRIGHVEDIRIRATQLRLLSGEQLTVPNALVFGGIVVNNTYYGDRRATITITMAQDTYKKEETPKQILDTIKKIETVMIKPEPAMYISAYTEDKVTLTLRFWIANGQITTVSDVMYTLRSSLPDADLTVVESAGND